MLPYGGNIEAWNRYCPNDASLTAPVPVAVERTEPDCANSGLMAHIACNLCGERFADETLYESITEDTLMIPALGHVYMDPEFVWAEDGSACTASFICSSCGDEQNPEAAITSETILEPDCLNPGQTEYTAALTFGVEEIPDPENPEGTIIQPKVYTDQLVLTDIPARGHTNVIISGIEPTCTEPGRMDYIFCEVCSEEIQTADEIPPRGHTETVTLEAIDPTCTEAGRTEEIGCSVCAELITPSMPVAALGHTEYVSAQAVMPDCVNTGLTEEISCSVCLEVTVPAETVPALGHTPETDAAVSPDCLNTGLTEGSHCVACDAVLVSQELIPVVEVSAVLSMPAALKVIENEAFENGTFICVIIPEGCTHIEALAFANCAQLQFIEIPASVISIDSTAFDGCSDNLVIVADADSEAVSFAEAHGIICVIR